MQLVPPLRKAELPQTSPIVETRLPLSGLRLVAYAADGQTLRVGNTKGRFQQLTTSELVPIGESESLPPFGMASATNTRDKRFAACGNWRGLTVVFDAKTTEIIGQCPDEPEKDPTAVTATKLSDDAALLVTGQRSSIVRLYDIKGQSMRWESSRLDQEISAVDLAPNGKFVAVSMGLLKDYNLPGKLAVLRSTDGQVIFTKADMSSKVNHVAITPDSKRILAADNTTLKIFDPRGTLLTVLPLMGIQRIRLVDNQRAILSRFPGYLCLVSIENGQMLKNYTGHAKNPEVEESQLIWALDIAPDGKTFASADTHGNVGIWDLSN